MIDGLEKAWEEDDSSALKKPQARQDFHMKIIKEFEVEESK